MTDFRLPTNVDIERLVLGSIMLDQELLHSVRPVLTPDDFGLEKHRRIWRRITDLFDAGRHVDRTTVADALMKAAELESVDGLTYLVSLDDGLPLMPDIGAYARILKDYSQRRRIIVAIHDVIRRAGEQEDPQALLDSLATMSVTLTTAAPGKGLVSAQQLVDRVGISEILAPRKSRGLPFPWEWLNSATCGMLPGDLWILAGHTSTGKSSAAIQTAVHVARTQGNTTAVFSLEMGDVSVFQRAVWQVARVDSERAKRGQLDQGERKRAGDVVNMLYDLPLYFDDSSQSVMEIYARLRRQRARGPLGLIVVDYLQLLREGGRHNTRAEAVGANARNLKLLAGEFACPILVLSQLSRDSAKTKPNEAPRRPELYDLKESGDIENHANGVWFIHRPSPTDADQVPVEFILAKQRDGRRNIMQDFWFFPKSQRFDAKEGG